MAKNRKSQSAALRFGPAVKAFVLCLIIGGSGVGYVWQKDQIVRLGQQLKNRELQLRALQIQNEKYDKQLATMRSVDYLEQRIKNLGLAQPQPGQVLRLVEPGTEPVPDRQIALGPVSPSPMP